MIKQLCVRADPWKWDVVVLVGGKVEEVERHVKAIGIDDPQIGSHAAGHAWITMNVPAIIWVETLDDVPCLAHEVIHAVCGIFEGRGLKHSAESEEAYTYTVEYLLRHILTAKKWERVRA